MDHLNRKERLEKFAILLLTSIIWGLSFPMQTKSVQFVEPYTINAIRYPIGALSLLPLLLRRKVKWSSETFLAGLSCGFCLFLASSLQQVGMQYTSSGKAGFITTFYIVLVPIFSLFIGKKNRLLNWIAAFIAIYALYLLSVNEELGAVQQGDFLIFLCSIVFSIHILLIDYFSPKVDNIAMSSLQFLVAGILSSFLVLRFESPNWASIQQAAFPLFFLGVISCGVAYTLQIVGQRGLNPSVASLLLSLESVFALLFATLLLGERLSSRELLGCALMFGAVILSQLPDKKENSDLRKENES